MRLATSAVAAAIALVWASAGAAPAADQPTRPSMHGSATPSPAPDHSGHDMSEMTEEEMADMGESDSHDQHGSTPEQVSSGTRTAVLGGFAAVNAGVLGGALLLRRHDRRHPRRGARPGRAAR
ncbi:MAG: hypothetical protein HYU55_08950 [Nocardioides sp.]|nr:hypothetical protein [Nocardioides sp.]